MNGKLRIIVISFFLLAPAAGEELRIASISGGFDPGPIPVVAFFDSQLDIRFSFDQTHASIAGNDIYYALFQRVGKRVIPLGDTVKGGIVEELEPGTLTASLAVKVPKLKTRAQLSLKAQVGGTKVGRIINFTALPDELLSQLAARNIIVTHAAEVEKAFADRNLPVSNLPLEELQQGGNWKGLWFVALTGDARTSFSMPLSLRPGQVVILLEADKDKFPVPIAIQRGAGWIIHFHESWFSAFSTNAGTQFFVFNTINQITAK